MMGSIVYSVLCAVSATVEIRAGCHCIKVFAPAWRKVVVQTPFAPTVTVRAHGMGLDQINYYHLCPAPCQVLRMAFGPGPAPRPTPQSITLSDRIYHLPISGVLRLARIGIEATLIACDTPQG